MVVVSSTLVITPNSFLAMPVLASPVMIVAEERLKKLDSDDTEEKEAETGTVSGAVGIKIKCELEVAGNEAVKFVGP